MNGRNIFIYLFLFCSILGCDYRKVKSIQNQNSLTLVGIGLTQTPNEQNKGFGPSYYCYINFDNDSIFIRRRFNYEDPARTEIKIGFIKNIASTDSLINGIIALEKLPNGDIKGTEIPEGSLYDGFNFYLEIKQGSLNRHFYYRQYNLDSAINKMTEKILLMQRDKRITVFLGKDVMNDDSIISPIVHSKDFLIAPPPPLNSKIRFNPPVINKE